jgi:hypothetical protein
MTWWGNSLDGASRSPKFKNKFLIEFGNGGFLHNVKSVSKPSATIEKKQYTMINHTYNYPGMVTWDAVTIKFVDAYGWGSGEVNIGGNGVTTSDMSTGQRLWEMLLATGYSTPRNTRSEDRRLVNVVSPEKAATITLAFGDYIKIHQKNNHQVYDPKTNKPSIVKETQDIWTLYNPIITKIQWGDLDYGDDAMVECTLEIAYDWAEFEAPKPTKTGPTSSNNNNGG